MFDRYLLKTNEDIAPKVAKMYRPIIGAKFVPLGVQTLVNNFWSHIFAPLQRITSKLVKFPIFQAFTKS